ncbi:MAG: T9SS type A sorting domain-containing protein [Ferruginibacter sp.]
MKSNYSTKPACVYSLIALFLFSGLTSFAQVDTWIQKADCGSLGRSYAVGFSIGSKGYIGTGSGYNSSAKDFWEYDPATNMWTQKADFGGSFRTFAVGFSIESKGYIGTGFAKQPNNNSPYVKDFWEYDPATNIWTQKADFGGSGRSFAVGFSIGSKGYIGLGEDFNISLNVKKDFWEYDPGTNMWTQRADFAGSTRTRAVGFSIGTKGYIGAGLDSAAMALQDFWEYDSGTNLWNRRADFGETIGFEPIGFHIGTKGYVMTAHTYDAFFLEYDPRTNLWTRKGDYLGGRRYGAVGFNIGANGYIGTGDLSFNYGNYTNDFWEYSTNNVLPVSLITFDIKKGMHVNELYWQTSGEINVDHYLIEHSSDGLKFSGLDKVNAAGNNQLTKNYSYTDQTPFNGTNFYRLKMVDKDGTIAYSKIVAVKNDNSKTLQIFPNPATNIVYIQASGENENALIQIFDLTGKKVKEQKIFINGNISLSIDVSNLQKSIYNLILKKGTKTEQQRFVKE